jgi:hypothetical protein
MIRVIFRDKKDGKVKALKVKSEKDASEFSDICRTGRNLRSRFEVIRIEINVEDDLKGAK